MKSPVRNHTTLFVALGIAVVALFVVDLAMGSVRLSVGEVWCGLWGGGDPVTRDIVLKFRLPKAVTAVIAGAALSVAGLQMQTIFRNPLAGPYVLGVSSGASLGVALFLLGVPVLGTGAGMEVMRNIGVTGAAWLGAGLIFGLIMVVSRRIKDIMVILILGMMFGSVAGAVVQILQYFSPDGALKNFVVWTMGSLGAVEMAQLRILAIVVVAGLVLSVTVIKPLNAMLLGEAYARTMGVNTGRTRTLVFVSTVLLAGTVTAFCGPIGFLGLAVPHIARMLTGSSDHRVLMPASMLLGTALMSLCDVISQLPGSGITLPVNTVTALVGIPVIIIVIVRNRKLF